MESHAFKKTNTNQLTIFATVIRHLSKTNLLNTQSGPSVPPPLRKNDNERVH